LLAHRPQALRAGHRLTRISADAWRRVRLLGAVAWGLTRFCDPSGAFADCPPSSADVSVSLQLAEPILDNSLWQPQLQELAGKEHHGGRTLGLYRMELQTGFRASIRSRQAGGWVCLWIEKVAITLAANPRQIYVVRERSPGTCPYNAVLAHERKHQSVDDELFNQSVPWLRHRIEKAILDLPRGQPTTASEVAATQAKLNKAMSEAVTSAVADMMAERKLRQSRVDDPREYQRVGAACQ
jgi:hypothetical protein